jgi:hypothetical protein
MWCSKYLVENSLLNLYYKLTIRVMPNSYKHICIRFSFCNPDFVDSSYDISLRWIKHTDFILAKGSITIDQNLSILFRPLIYSTFASRCYVKYLSSVSVSENLTGFRNDNASGIDKHVFSRLSLMTEKCSEMG